MFLTQKELKRAIFDEKSKIRPLELFLSSAYTMLLLTMVKGIVTSFKGSVKVAKSLGGVIACTDSSTVFVSVENSLTENLNTIETHMVLCGLVLHECGHILFTDFELSALCRERMKKGDIYPPPLDNPYLEEVRDFLKTNTHSADALYTIYHRLDNCIEDGFVDRIMKFLIPGYGKCLSFVAKIDNEFTKPYKEMVDEGLSEQAIFSNLVLAYARHGELAFEETDENEELIKSFLDTTDTIKKAVFERNAHQRKRYTFAVFCYLFHFVKMQNEKQQQQGPSGDSNDSDENSNGSDESSNDSKGNGSPDEKNTSEENSGNSSNSSSAEEDESSSDSEESKGDSSSSAENSGDSKDEQADNSKDKKGTNSSSETSGNDEDETSDSTPEGSEDGEDENSNSSSESSEENGESDSEDDSSTSSNISSGKGNDESTDSNNMEESDGNADEENCSDSSISQGATSPENEASEKNETESECSSSNNENVPDDSSEENIGDYSVPSLNDLFNDLADNMGDSEKNEHKNTANNQRSANSSELSGLTSLLDNLSNEEQENLSNNDRTDTDASETSTDLERMLEKMAEEKVAKQQEKEIERTANTEIRDITRNSDYHENIPCNFIRVQPNDYSRQIYEEQKAELDSITRRFIKDFVSEVEDRQRGDILTGLYNGKRVKANNVYRHDKRIFSSKIAPEDIPNMAIGFLIDCSGSTFGERIENAIKCAYITYKFCKALNIPIFIIGHDTSGSAVNLYSVADDKSLDRKDEERIFSLHAGGGNRDGFALRYCLNKLRKIQAEQKIMFVVSDGRPAHYGYYEEEGRIDCQDAVRSAIKDGIITIAAGIGDVESIRRVYNQGISPKVSAKYLDLSDLKRLPKAFIKIIKEYLK